jgi:hypothetical protein
MNIKFFYRQKKLKSRLKSFSWFLIVAYLLVFTSETQLALAESGATDTSVSSQTIKAPFGLLIAWWICNSNKRKAIGGWLMYYYIQLFIGIFLVALITLISTETLVFNLNINNWDNEMVQYFLYILSIIPVDLLLVTELVFGSMLLTEKFRNRKIYNFLRITLVSQFIFGMISLLININYYPESVIFDILQMMGSVFWFLYFTFSKRVNFVFVENKWDPNVMYPANDENTTRYTICSSCGLKCKNIAYVCSNCGKKFWRSRKHYEKFLTQKKSS